MGDEERSCQPCEAGLAQRCSQVGRRLPGPRAGRRERCDTTGATVLGQLERHAPAEIVAARVNPLQPQPVEQLRHLAARSAGAESRAREGEESPCPGKSTAMTSRCSTRLGRAGSQDRRDARSPCKTINGSAAPARSYARVLPPSGCECADDAAIVAERLVTVVR